jgi:lysophospholipase L1-like esterase
MWDDECEKGNERRAKMWILILIVAGFAGSSPIGAGEQMTLFLVGDSTMAERENLDRKMRGWGQMLQPFFTDEVVVENHARGGRSTKSFISEERWQVVFSRLKPGDYVLIQFGHNDQKYQDPKRFTNPYTGYRRNLERFVKEARAKKAHAILATSIVRRKFNDDGVVVDTYGNYPLVTRLVAEDLDVPFVDLQLLTEDLIQEYGVGGSRVLFTWPEPGEEPEHQEGLQDNSHLSAAGGMEVARLVAQELKRLSHPLAEKLKN